MKKQIYNAIFILIGLLVVAGCGSDGGENPASSSQTVISWIGPVNKVYSYSGGILAGLKVNSDIEVTGESGSVELIASLMKNKTSTVPIDKETNTFYVETGNRYNVSVKVTLHEKFANCISFGDENVLLLSSPSSNSVKEIGLDACYVSTALGEIQLTQ